MERFYFANSCEITTKIYDYCSEWHTKLQFALLNSQTLQIAMTRKSELTYIVRSSLELTKIYHIPIMTAISIELVHLNDIKYSFFANLFDKNRWCSNIIMNLNQDEIEVSLIQEVCKVCAKNNVNITVLSSPQKQIFENLFAKFSEKYRIQFERYANNVTKTICIPEKRKNMELVEVPTDINKRIKYHVDQANKLLNSTTSVHVYNDTLELPHELKRVVTYDACFKRYEDSQYPKLNLPLLNLAEDDLKKVVHEVASRFVDAIIVFDNIYFYITSVDIFVHNHLTLDDCAYGITSNEYHDLPYAEVRSNTYLGSSSYHELSIYFKYFEILVTGGYFSVTNGPLQPFLGSSLGSWHYGEKLAGSIYIASSDNKLDVAMTERLLNQYKRRFSHHPWGFHSMKSFLDGYSPIIPLHYFDHVSQKNRSPTIHHFGSKLLYISTCPQITTKNEITGLFLFLASTRFFLNLCNQVKQYPISFSEFYQILNQQEQVSVFTKYLVAYATSIENQVNAQGNIFLSCLFSNTEYANAPLAIMKNGLKSDINRQTTKIIKNKKSNLS